MRLLASLYDLADRRRVPIDHTIELVADCPLHCRHCYVTRSKVNQLTLPVVTDLLSQIAVAGGLIVTLTGGEVALRPDLFEIIAEARRHRLAVQLLTSGVLWGAHEWDEVARLAVGAVRLSVYAADPAIHDAVVALKGAHARTLATARGLLERGVQVALSCPITGANAAQTGAVAALAAELGVSVGFDPKITWTDRGDPRTAATRASVEQLAAAYRDPEVAGECTPATESGGGDDEAPCRAGRIGSFIECTGDVLPCANWPASAGNLLERPLAEIWHEGAAFREARAMRNSSLTGCMGCRHRGVCRPCPAMNLRETGSIALPSPVVCANAAALASVVASPCEG